MLLNPAALRRKSKGLNKIEVATHTQACTRTHVHTYAACTHVHMQAHIRGRTPSHVTSRNIMPHIRRCMDAFMYGQMHKQTQKTPACTHTQARAHTRAHGQARASTHTSTSNLVYCRTHTCTHACAWHLQDANCVAASMQIFPL